MKYLSLAETYQQLESTSKRLDKTTIVAQFLQKTKVEDLEITTLLLQGIVFPIWDSKRIGIADRLVLKAINISTGISLDDLEKLWKKTGDLGLVA